MATFDIVFEGGGAKGSAFAGALTALTQQGHHTRRLIGTSAGAITAALTGAGYSADELLAAVNEKRDGKPRFAGFMDHPKSSDFSQDQRNNSETMRALRDLHIPMLADHVLLGLLLDTPVYPTLFSFVECGGLFAGDDFVVWLTEKLAAKGITAADTMATFFAKKGVDLSVVTSDTTDMEMLVLNHRTAPDVPLVFAVRMSMSIPLVWREIVWQDAWGEYQGRAKAGNIMVDGGVLSNFPIRLIAEPAPDIMGDYDPQGALNLGLLLDEKLAVAGTNIRWHPELVDDMRVVQRVSRLIDTMMASEDNDEIRRHAGEICRLPVKGYGTTEFNMDSQKLQNLVSAAHESTIEHLKSRNLFSAGAP